MFVAFASFSSLLGFFNTEMLTGWIKISTGATWLWLAIAVAMMCFCLMMTVVSGRIKANDAVSKFLRNLLFCAISVVVAWLVSLLNGRTSSDKMSELLFLVALFVALLIYSVQYFIGSSKSAKLASANSLRKSAAGAGVVRYDYASLFGGAMLSALLLIAGLVLKQDVLPLLVSFSLVAVAFLLWRLTGWRGWLMVAAAFIVAVLCCRIDDMQYSLQQLPYIIALTYSVLALTMPCVDLYSRSEENI